MNALQNVRWHWHWHLRRSKMASLNAETGVWDLGPVHVLVSGLCTPLHTSPAVFCEHVFVCWARQFLSYDDLAVYAPCIAETLQTESNQRLFWFPHNSQKTTVFVLPVLIMLRTTCHVDEHVAFYCSPRIATELQYRLCCVNRFAQLLWAKP